MTVVAKPSRHAAATQSAQAARIGQLVLAGLQKAQRIARELHRERVQQHQVQICYLLLEDQQKGRPRRGVAGRISRKLGCTLSERQVRRYLKKITGRAI